MLVSRAPIWRGEWLAHLPQRQRLISMLLRTLPRLANLLVWAMLSYVNKANAEEFLRGSRRESRSDLTALDNPETVRLVASGIEVGPRQGVDSFCKDWALMENDLVADAASLPHPIRIVHGADDQIIRAEYSRLFAEAVPGATLEVVEGAGNLLFYSHWRHLIEALLPVDVESVRDEARVVTVT